MKRNILCAALFYALALSGVEVANAAENPFAPPGAAPCEMQNCTCACHKGADEAPSVEPKIS